MIKSSEKIELVCAAIAKAQAEMKDPKKNASNPFFKSKYAPLSELRNVSKDILGKYGLSVIQSCSLSNIDGFKFISVETGLYHSSGQFLISTCELPLGKLDPQGGGSAFTYGRRYGLQAALGLAAEEDDDANAAMPQPIAKTKTAPQSVVAQSRANIRTTK